MLLVLVAFTIGSLALPVLVRAWGPRAFFFAAAVSFGAFVYTAALSPRVLASDIPFESFTWIGPLDIALSMRMDTLSWVLALIVTGVGALVLLYCRWYFDGKQDLGQFAAVLLAFAGAMYALVLTDDVVVLVMFWEVTSVLSYLLIGYYNRRAASRRAALQALLVTTLGGLVMLIGVVLIVVQAGTSSLSEILADPPVSPVATAALVLLLVGALSKSAIFPFHFWLPGAMAAPTPVSAYLHAAAMVKAGIYLVAVLAPVFAENPAWHPIVIGLGGFTMLLGGWQALRETDLKRLLAYGTVSQLGFLMVVLGYGTQDAALAGLALLLSHALFKSALFLVVGIIDHQLSTRDLREISGLGRQAPALATAAIVSIASMVGIIPTVGFVAKEGALAALLDEALGGSVWGLIALLAVVAGSVLTAAYGIRFVWGAFWTKRDIVAVSWPAPSAGFVSAPVILAILSLGGGFAAPLLDVAFTPYAQLAPAATSGVPAPEHPAYLALWHGFEPALWISLGTIALGAVLFVFTARGVGRRRVLPFTAVDAYNGSLRMIERLSVLTTTLVQRGSLPVYVATIFLVLVAGEGTALLASSDWQADLDAFHTPVQLAVAPVMIAAGVIAVRARKRYTGVVLVSVTGLGMVVLFATSGAPDLALTQILVETVTLVAFALVLRRIPSRLGAHNGSAFAAGRAVLAVLVGLTMAGVAIVATGARVDLPISLAFPNLAYEIGYGKNVVNVALVDLRGWDTMGELSVVVLAATGVASLVFVTNRSDSLPQITAPIVQRAQRALRRRTPLAETDADGPTGRNAWLVAGQRVRPENRSILLEIVVRILFHSIIIVSLYLLFAGHNLPGGGFAAGLVAGMALVMRYIAGGRYELGAAAPTDAGRFLGIGMGIAVACAIIPLAFGVEPLTRAIFEAEVPVLGHIEFVTSTIFDIGVYLVVIGLVLDVLRSLGAEVDRQANAAVNSVAAREGVSGS